MPLQKLCLHGRDDVIGLGARFKTVINRLKPGISSNGQDQLNSMEDPEVFVNSGAFITGRIVRRSVPNFLLSGDQTK